jgi:hypothetical protein
VLATFAKAGAREQSRGLFADSRGRFADLYGAPAARRAHRFGFGFGSRPVAFAHRSTSGHDHTNARPTFATGCRLEPGQLVEEEHASVRECC